MKRFIVIVLDGLGVGAMEDVEKTRPNDIGANTCLHILKEKKELTLKNLEKIGLMNVLGEEVNGMKFSKKATYGKANLAHWGADTFFGHQEIMGTKPKNPFTEPIKNKIDKIYQTLNRLGYNVRYSEGYTEKFIIVNEALTIADNIECDLGQAINITAVLDVLNFDEVVKIGRIIRDIVKVPRVIVFGGKGINIDNILAAVEEKSGGFIGINAPKSGVYNNGYECVHLGYGVDANTQVSTILSKNGIPVYLIGKVADVITNNYGVNIPMVDTELVCEEVVNVINNIDEGFICCNIQETDLAGHSEDVKKYAEKLIIADELIGRVIDKLNRDDILIVTADHGNDPTIGHSKHTREMVPILIEGKRVKNGNIGTRMTLSDIGATISDFFNIDNPENGCSFLNEITDIKMSKFK